MVNLLLSLLALTTPAMNEGSISTILCLSSFYNSLAICLYSKLITCIAFCSYRLVIYSSFCGAIIDELLCFIPCPFAACSSLVCSRHVCVDQKVLRYSRLLKRFCRFLELCADEIVFLGF